MQARLINPREGVILYLIQRVLASGVLSNQHSEPEEASHFDVPAYS